MLVLAAVPWLVETGGRPPTAAPSSVGRVWRGEAPLLPLTLLLPLLGLLLSLLLVAETVPFPPLFAAVVVMLPRPLAGLLVVVWLAVLLLVLMLLELFWFLPSV